MLKSRKRSRADAGQSAPEIKDYFPRRVKKLREEPAQHTDHHPASDAAKLRHENLSKDKAEAPLWFEDAAKLYLFRHPSRVGWIEDDPNFYRAGTRGSIEVKPNEDPRYMHFGDAHDWTGKCYDRPEERDHVFNIAEDGNLSLTPVGKQRLSEIKILSWEGKYYRAYSKDHLDNHKSLRSRLARTDIRERPATRNIMGSKKPYIYRRDGDQFLSADNYIKLYGSVLHGRQTVQPTEEQPRPDEKSATPAMERNPSKGDPHSRPFPPMVRSRESLGRG